MSHFLTQQSKLNLMLLSVSQQTFPLSLCGWLHQLNHHCWHFYPQDNHIWLQSALSQLLTVLQPQLNTGTLAERPLILMTGDGLTSAGCKDPDCSLDVMRVTSSKSPILSVNVSITVWVWIADQSIKMSKTIVQCAFQELPEPNVVISICFCFDLFCFGFFWSNKQTRTTNIFHSHLYITEKSSKFSHLRRWNQV